MAGLDWDRQRLHPVLLRARRLAHRLALRWSSTDVRRYGGCDLEEAKMWLAGDPMDPDREIPTQTKWEREGW